MMHRWLSYASLLLGVTSVGCKCDTEERHPYTPFGVASTTSPPPKVKAPTSVDAGSSASPEDFVPAEGTEVNPPTESIELTDGLLEAPAGMKISNYLVADFDYDGTKDRVAWVVPVQRQQGEAPGSLWFLPAEGKPRQVYDFPSFVPTGQDCSHQTTLHHSGPFTVTVDVSAQCPQATIPRAPMRSVSIIRVLPETREVLQLRLAPPPQGEQLALGTETTDRDADGHDDVLVRFVLRRGESESNAEASFVWLDRTSGLARDMDPTTTSFIEAATLAKQTSAANPLRLQIINNTRRLYAYVCGESQSFRVTHDDGSALNCGDLSKPLSDLFEAEVGHALARKAPGEALAALQRASWYGAAPSSRVMARLKSDIQRVLPLRKTEMIKLPIRPRAPGAGPRHSPLAYTDDGDLYVLGNRGIHRYDGRDIEEASFELDAWPLIPMGPSGARLLGLEFPCDSAYVTVSSQDPEGRIETALTTNLLSPRPGACSGGRVEEPELRLIEWTSRGLRAMIGPLVYGRATRSGAMGAPLSPDGRSLVSVTPLGVLVQHEGQLYLWEAPVDTLSECVVANGARRVACIDDGEVLVITLEGTNKRESRKETRPTRTEVRADPPPAPTPDVDLTPTEKKKKKRPERSWR